MAHVDPGFHNWIDTSGFNRGVLVNRNQATDHITEFRTQVVKHVDLERRLPAGSARVTGEERAAQMRRRFHAILQRYML